MTQDSPQLDEAPAVHSRRRLVHRTRGTGHGGPIVRLMSPSDLGRALKPFVFLDIFDLEGRGLHAMSDMPIHPHSGIATVTVFTEGSSVYNDPVHGSGTLGYGGVEWMRASGGVWHGKEMSAGDVSRIQGFQLWVALPPELENEAPESRFIEAQDMPSEGPAVVIVGRYKDVQSPVPAPEGLNYLLVTLKAGESWTYTPPAGHAVGWLALASGELDAGNTVNAGEMVIFEPGEAAIELRASEEADAKFVLGSAVPHPHPLHLGNYSVHTSAKALEMGELRIGELGKALTTAGNRTTHMGTIPIFR